VAARRNEIHGYPRCHEGRSEPQRVHSWLATSNSSQNRRQTRR
jgi:hypothetical protein